MSSFGGPRLILTVPGGSSRPNKTSSVKKSKFSKLSLMPFCQITADLYSSILFSTAFIIQYTAFMPKSTWLNYSMKRRKSSKFHSVQTSPKKVENTPMMPLNANMNNSMIMPQDLDKLNNSPYRSHMTAEDERLLQVNIGSRDPTENMYSDVHGAQVDICRVRIRYLNDVNCDVISFVLLK